MGKDKAEDALIFVLLVKPILELLVGHFLRVAGRAAFVWVVCRLRGLGLRGGGWGLPGAGVSGFLVGGFWGWGLSCCLGG